MTASIVIAEPRPVVRAGLRAWFDASSVHIVGEARDGPEAKELVERHTPRVLLLEVDLPKADGIGVLGWLNDTHRQTAALFLSDRENPTYAARASAQGAAGFLSKTIEREALIESVLTVAAGGVCWTADDVRRLTAVSPEGPSTIADVVLTVRERQVLKQLSFGLSNKEIAQALGISYETVKEHVQHVLRKLGVSDRTQAAVWAVRNRLA
ncbi:MAG: response regulator transcription factor [Planctomycetota bacterium]